MSGASGRGGLLARLLRGWREIGAGLGTLLALVALCGALGAAIALPLWLFATSYRRIYTIVVAAAAGAGIVFLVVRRLARPPSGRGAEGSSARRALGSIASALLAAVRIVLLVASAGAAVSFAVGGLYLAALPAAAAALATAAWIGIAAGSRKRR